MKQFKTLLPFLYLCYRITIQLGIKKLGHGLLNKKKECQQCGLVFSMNI